MYGQMRRPMKVIQKYDRVRTTAYSRFVNTYAIASEWSHKSHEHTRIHQPNTQAQS